MKIDSAVMYKLKVHEAKACCVLYAAASDIKVNRYQEDVVASAEGEESIDVSFSDYRGGLVNVTLPIGGYNFSDTTQNGTDCQFIVSVTRKYSFDVTKFPMCFLKSISLFVLACSWLISSPVNRFQTGITFKSKARF